MDGDKRIDPRHSMSMKWIDIPPIWLLVFLVATWWIGRLAPFGLSIDGALTQLLGGLLVGGGLLLMVLAVLEMRRHRTTVIPHMKAASLVTSGIFNYSRNPIYLGDAMILAGLALRWDAVLALVFVPVFMLIIEKRFILAEERMLRQTFTADFGRYYATTRRWL